MMTFKEIYELVRNNDYEWPSHKNKKIGGWSYKSFVHNRNAFWLMNDIGIQIPRDIEDWEICNDLNQDWNLWLLQHKLRFGNWKDEFDINNHH